MLLSIILSTLEGGSTKVIHSPPPPPPIHLQVVPQDQKLSANKHLGRCQQARRKTGLLCANLIPPPSSRQSMLLGSLTRILCTSTHPPVRYQVGRTDRYKKGCRAPFLCFLLTDHFLLPTPTLPFSPRPPLLSLGHPSTLPPYT